VGVFHVSIYNSGVSSVRDFRVGFFHVRIYLVTVKNVSTNEILGYHSNVAEDSSLLDG
jgi:hypothetical protein